MRMAHAGNHFASRPLAEFDVPGGKQDALHAAAHLCGALLTGTLATGLAVCMWLMLSIATGFLNVFMTVPVGMAAGLAVWMYSRKGRHDYRAAAVILTLLGSMIGNVLAGLSLFSTKVGVGYWQVLASRRIPEDLAMLGTTFARSVEIDHVFFYALAVYLAYRLSGMKSARR